MPKSPEGSPARPDGPEQLFQLFWRPKGGPNLPLELPSRRVIAIDLLKIMNACREPGEIFWIEKAGSASGEPGGVVTNYDEIEHHEIHIQISDLNMRQISRLNIRRPSRVCAATPYRRSRDHPASRRQGRYRRAVLDWLVNDLLCGPHQPAEMWIIRALLVIYASMAIILIAETILGP